MSNRRRVLYFVLLLTLCIYSSTGFSQSSCGPLGDPSSCGPIPQPDPTGGGNYYACSANGSWGQQCQALVLNESFARECASVWRNGYCDCNPRTLKVTGSCTYTAR